MVQQIKRKLIHSSTRGTATLCSDSAGQRRDPYSVSVSLHRQVHQSVPKPCSCWPRKTSAQNYNDDVWQESFLLFKNSLKRSQRQNAKGMKIYNSQLVMGLVFRSTLLQFTLQVIVATMARCTEIHVCSGSLFGGFLSC